MELRTDDNKGRLCEFLQRKSKVPLQHCTAAGRTLNREDPSRNGRISNRLSCVIINRRQSRLVYESSKEGVPMIITALKYYTQKIKKK